MKFSLTLVIALLLVSNSYSQSNVLFKNAKIIDEDRYKGIDGSPYAWDEWLVGTIYDNKGNDIPDVEININGNSEEIEIRKDNKFIELQEMLYAKIELSQNGSPILLVRGFQSLFKTDFVEVVHEGTNVSIVRKFSAKLEELELQNVGKTEKIKRFKPRYTYYFIKGGKSSMVKAKKKQIIAFLGKRKVMDAFIDTVKLKKNRKEHLKEIAAYYDSL